MGLYGVSHNEVCLLRILFTAPKFISNPFVLGSYECLEKLECLSFRTKFGNPFFVSLQLFAQIKSPLLQIKKL